MILYVYYYARGPQSGWCGHRHRTLAAAWRCRLKHNSRLQKYEGPDALTDRVIYHEVVSPVTGHTVVTCVTPPWQGQE